jgi:hypothetical protein
VIPARAAAAAGLLAAAPALTPASAAASTRSAPASTPGPLPGVLPAGPVAACPPAAPGYAACTLMTGAGAPGRTHRTRNRAAAGSTRPSSDRRPAGRLQSAVRHPGNQLPC